MEEEKKDSIPDLIFKKTFEIDYIPSVNSMLGVGKNGKRFLNPEAKKYKWDIQSQISKTKDLHFLYDGKRGIVVKLIFVLKQSYLARDLDNMQKMTIDAIFQYYKVNDSRIVDLHSIKLFDGNLVKEYVKVVAHHSLFNATDYIVK